jgi:hypothetical protein
VSLFCFLKFVHPLEGSKNSKHATDRNSARGEQAFSVSGEQIGLGGRRPPVDDLTALTIYSVSPISQVITPAARLLARTFAFSGRV